MAEKPLKPGETREVKPAKPTGGDPTVVVRVDTGRRGIGWVAKLLAVGLIVSVIVNLSMYSAYRDYFADSEPPSEQYHSGSRTATARIALLEVTGTIMPPYTERYLRTIERIADDPNVKGLLLVVDSPGGLVADSHQIYSALVELREETEKPIVVVMKRMAASGGLYIAMAAGPEGTIFAEPTCWTGSIGVIVPHYDLSGFAEHHGIAGTHPALKTGPLKDSLSPLRPLSEEDERVWRAILDDSFTRFKKVIADNRDALDLEDVDALATGQIYTTNQALENGLVDREGFEEDALAELRKQIDRADVRVVTYSFPQTIWETLLGSVEATTPENTWRHAMESTVPRAMYYCSFAPFYAGR